MAYHPPLPLAPLITCLILGACSDSTAPAFTAGGFVLVSANGDSVPAFIAPTGGCDEYILSGSIALAADHTFELAGVARLDCSPSGGAIQDQPLALAGTYTQSGQQIAFTLPGQGTLSGHLAADTLTATLPASPFAFPVPVALLFLKRPGL
jgi:hypothetical protein